jgi:hypothetical protein
MSSQHAVANNMHAGIQMSVRCAMNTNRHSEPFQSAKMRLYGLFKTVTCGKCDVPKPAKPMVILGEDLQRAKWVSSKKFLRTVLNKCCINILNFITELLVVTCAYAWCVLTYSRCSQCSGYIAP